MPKATFKILALTPSKGYWRIDFLGGQMRPGQGKKLNIAVYISPAVTDPPKSGFGLHKSLVVSSQRRRVWVDIRFLPFLEIGSWWLRGVNAKVIYHKPLTKQLKTVFAHKIVKLKDVHHVRKDSKDLPYLQSLDQDFFHGPFLDEIAESLLVVYTNREGNLYFAVPCIELIRRYYCFTEAGIYALFNGEYRDKLTAWKADKKHYFPQDDSVSLCLRGEDYGNWPLVAFAESHPNGWAYVNRVYDSLAKQQVNSTSTVGGSKNRILYPEAVFPIPAVVDLQFLGHKLQGSLHGSLESEQADFSFAYQILSNTLIQPDTSRLRIVQPKDIISNTHLIVEGYGVPIAPSPTPDPPIHSPTPGPTGPDLPIARPLVYLVELNMNPFDSGGPERVEIKTDKWVEKIIPEGDPDLVDPNLLIGKDPTDIVGFPEPPGIRIPRQGKTLRKPAIEAGFDNLKIKLDRLTTDFTANWRYAKIPERLCLSGNHHLVVGNSQPHSWVLISTQN